jgi:hypothetical protein
MKLNFYSVFDKAIGAYTRPFVMQSDGQAMRQFADEATKEGTPIEKHPEDYALFRIGVFNESTGEITPEEPLCLVRAHELAEVLGKESE